MPASYPAGIKAFPTYAAGDQVTPITINDPNLEINAIERGLLSGLGHTLSPDATGNHRSLGTSASQWYDLFLSHDLHVAGAMTFTSGSIQGDLDINGNVTIHQGLTVLTGINVNSILTTGVLTVEGTLHITGDPGSTFEHNIAVFGNAAMQTATITGALTTGGDVHVTGGTGIFDHGITVTGNAAMTVANITNTLGVGGATTLSGTLDVLGATHLHNNLLVDGTTTLSGTVSMPGSVSVGATLFAKASIVTQKDIIADPPTSITVGTSPTTIYTGLLIHGVDVGGLVLVSGTDMNNGSVAFLDVVAFMTNAFAQIVFSGFKGGDIARTYSISGANLQMKVALDQFHVVTMPLMIATPAP